MKVELLSSVENDESVSNRIVQFLSVKPNFFIINFLVYLINCNGHFKIIKIN